MKADKKLATQYTGFIDTFLRESIDYNRRSQQYFYGKVDPFVKGRKLLDVACGEGHELAHYRELGAIPFGMDANPTFVELARQRNPGLEIKEGLMEELPYEDNSFDMVVSKWAMQSSPNVPGVIKEMHRVLKPQGILAYLTVSPMRQFMEKKKKPRNYFEQELVHSNFFGGKVTAIEPSHTMKEYLSKFYHENFREISFDEEEDFPSCEQVDGERYPCFMVITAIKQDLPREFRI